MDLDHYKLEDPDPDPVHSKLEDPDPVCSELEDPDPVHSKLQDPDPVKNGPDPQPCFHAK